MKRKIWPTVFRAIDPADGILKSWAGPRAFGDTEDEALQYLKDEGISYCFLEPHEFAV